MDCSFLDELEDFESDDFTVEALEFFASEELDALTAEELEAGAWELEDFESDDCFMEELETDGSELEEAAIEELETEALDAGFFTVIVPVAVALLSVPATLIVKT